MDSKTNEHLHMQHVSRDGPNYKPQIRYMSSCSPSPHFLDHLFSLVYKSAVIRRVLQHHSVYNSSIKAVSCSRHTTYMCMCVLKKHVKNVFTCVKKELSVDDCLWCFNALKNVVQFGFSSSFKVNA